MAVLAYGAWALVPSSQSWDTSPNVPLQLFVQQCDKNRPDSLPQLHSDHIPKGTTEEQSSKVCLI